MTLEASMTKEPAVVTAKCVLCGGDAHDVPAEEADDAICVDCGFDALERRAS